MPDSKKQNPNHAIVTSQTIRPQDDFYNYVCWDWLQKNPRPPDQSCWGHFSALATKVDVQVEQIFNDWLESGPELAPGPKQAVSLYQTYHQKDQLAAAGAETLVATYQRLIKPLTPDNLAVNLGQLARLGLACFWDFSVDTNNQDPQNFILSLDQLDLNLPDRSYYLDSADHFRSCRWAYRRFVGLFWRQTQVELHQLVGDDHIGRVHAARLLAIESQIANWLAPTEQLNHPKQSTNIYTRSELLDNFDFDWAAYFEGLGLKEPPAQINVAQPEFLKSVVTWLGSASVADIRLYLTWQLIINLAPYLNETLTTSYFDFFGRVLHGQGQLKPLSLRARQFVSRELIDTVGQEYCQRHFSPDQRTEVEQLTAEVCQAFARRLAKLDWLGEASRQAALVKLERISVNLGRPKTWACYAELKIDPDNLVQTQLNLAEFNSARSLELLGQKPQRQNFNLGPGPYGAQVVDAWTDPCLLTTNYTAAILQPPFYDPQADWAFNLGAIGSIIGHELTHHFDNLGSHYDPEGRLRDWLKPSERQAFDQATQPLLQAADQFAVLPGVYLKGSQVLGEALADFGGLVLAIEVVDARCQDKSQRQQLYRRVLESYAYYNLQNPTNEFRIAQTFADEHPDSVFRVNGIVSHLPAFYEAYGLKPGDGLYLDPADRAQVW